MNINLEDFNFSNKKFWIGFIALSFPTALDEETDMSLSEIIEKIHLVILNGGTILQDIMMGF